MITPMATASNAGMNPSAAMNGPMAQHPPMPIDNLPYPVPQAPMGHNNNSNNNNNNNSNGLHQPDVNALSNALAGMPMQDGPGLRPTNAPLPPLAVSSPQVNIMPTHGHPNQQGLLFMHNGVIYAPTGVGPYACMPSPGNMVPGPALPDRHAARVPLYDHRRGFGLEYGHGSPMTPAPRAFAPVPEHVVGDPPGLDDRQVSIGSHSDEQVSSPDTPDAGDANRLGQNVVIARADVSPLVQYGYGAHSPHHFMPQIDPSQIGKAMAVRQLTNDLRTVTSAPPPIPQAVPAVSSCRKTLQHCFENPTGTTNVYIRGLHPNTTDEMLLMYAARFGHVANSKAMIDNQTGACKGFGFACYRTIEEAQNCIRGFYFLGYEVSFARESFNARLKSFSDPGSTNLYVSNLPRSMTEVELEAVFHEFKCTSSRIIRDLKGHSKGVGFARFASRDECDVIIKKYNGQAIGQEQLLMQVRYADTPEQKRLKQETQKRREFRANEYNAVAYGGSALYPFRTVRADVLEATLAANRARCNNDLAWAGFGTPNLSTVGRTPPTKYHHMENAKCEGPVDSGAKAESDATPRLSGTTVDENTPVHRASPSIAYGDTYSTLGGPTVVAEA